MPKRFAQVLWLSSIVVLLRPTIGQDTQTNVPLRLLVVGSADEAAKLRQRLANSEADFAVLAREKSTDPTSIDGGAMGSVDPTTLRAELRDALRGLKPGDISPVVKLPSGYALVKILPPSEVASLEASAKARQFAVSAEGSIQFDFDISGMNEIQAALAGTPKPDDWYMDLANACAVRQRSSRAVADRADALLNGKTLQPYDRMSVLVSKGQLFAYHGDMDRAVEQWEAAYQLALKEVPRGVPYMEKLLGIGYLHRAQTANEVFRKPGDFCLFPIRPVFKWPNSSNSEKAVEFLKRSLERKPDDLESRWLLNIAYMSLGNYPAGVPKAALIPPDRFTSKGTAERFQDVARKAGIDLFSLAAGVIVDDFGNNGRFDIVTSSFDMCTPMHYFHNNGDGTFTDQTGKTGLQNQLGGLNIIQADYNNDGCTDILVLRGGWEIAQRKSLLKNNCNGTFADVTVASGLASPATASQTAVWADVNNDGLLDLFVGNENRPNQLFLNQGEGRFKDVAHAAGVDQTAFTKSVAAADYDHDGFIDFYVGNYRGDNLLLHNNGNGTFTDIAKQAGVTGTGHTFPSWFFDYNNDGWPDLFVASYNMSVAETAKTYLGLPHSAGTLKLYKNLGNGAFEDVTVEVGLDKVFMPMGSNFGDIDNDGYPDIYLGTGDPSYASLAPNVLLHNEPDGRGGRRFVDVTASSGTGDIHKGHGVAFADIDNDGDEDILTVIGGAARGDAHAFRLFENPGHRGNNWINVRLVGTKGNRSAIGARIHVSADQGGDFGLRRFRTVGSGGSFGASPLEQHVGIGPMTRVFSIEVIWPGDSSPRQVARDVPINQTIEITEGVAGFKKIDRKPVRLGGAVR